MEVSEYLFPKELEVTPFDPKNVLIVGTCAAMMYVYMLKFPAPNTHFDHMFYNNAADLPDEAHKPFENYDFQLVTVPLRDIVTDRILDFSQFTKPEINSDIQEQALANLRLMLDGSLKYNRKHGLLTFVLNFSTPSVPVSASLNARGGDFDFVSLVDRLNKKITSIISEYNNVYLIDINSISSAVGKQYISDDSFGFYGHSGFWIPEAWQHDHSPGYHAPIPHRIDPVPRLEDFYGSKANDLIRGLWANAKWLYRATSGLDRVKLVIFDLDHTLWRGEIAEHYGTGIDWPVIHGWPLGIWEAVQHLKARGILVAISSKNEESIVKERWERAVQFGWVSLEDFTFVKINWQPKAKNVKAIITAANLTAASTVFVDDNPVEREAVREAIPGIRVIGSNPYATRRTLLWSAETQIPHLTQESSNRDAMMRKQQERELARSTQTQTHFLENLGASLNMAEVNSVSDENFPRAFELINKTNQFNTTGKRWTLPEAQDLFSSGGKFFIFWVEDKYTKYGLVGVICYRDGIFAQYTMSCRVLGLEVETSAVNAILKKESNHYSEFFAEVLETEANMVCRSVYNKCGFSKAGDTLKRSNADIEPVASHIKFKWL